MSNPYQAPNETPVSADVVEPGGYTLGDAVSHEMNLDDVLALNDYIHRKSPTLWSAVVVTVSVVALFIEGLGIWLWLAAPGGLDPAVGLLVTFVIGPAYVFYTLWSVRRRARRLTRKLLAEGKNRSVLSEHRIFLNDEGITSETALIRSLYRWPVIERIVETSEYLFLFVSGFSAIVIPKRAFASDEHWQTFVQEARQRATDAAYVDDRRMKLKT